MRFLILFFTAVVFCFGCSNDKQNTASSEKLIRELLRKYPQLIGPQNDETSAYHLTRSIKDNDWKAEFECYEGYHTGIIVIKKEAGAVAIPLFDIDQADYWNLNSLKHPGIKKNVSTTFEQELKRANKMLKLSSDFLFFRYLFEHVLLLRESNYPKPCPKKWSLPMQACYQGDYNFVLTVQSRDSLSIKVIPTAKL